MPRSGRQSDHTKTSWSFERDSNWRDVDLFLVYQVWLKPSCKAQGKKDEDKADRKRGRKTTLGNGQVWSSPSPRGQWRTKINRGN